MAIAVLKSLFIACLNSALNFSAAAKISLPAAPFSSRPSFKWAALTSLCSPLFTAAKLSGLKSMGLR
ncbi:MAG: hypothetical protein BWY75_02016 [bacterium ADurb.Bin425]|nr:MAG: hypothetical protein BWY75_02016 [bacterium ADurb.Bin425]